MTVQELMSKLLRLPPETEVLVPGYEMYWDALDLLLIGKSQRVIDGKKYDGEYRVSAAGIERIMLCSHRHKPEGGQPFEPEAT